MAQIKISELPVTTSSRGSVPIVQDGATKQLDITSLDNKVGKSDVTTYTADQFTFNTGYGPYSASTPTACKWGRVVNLTGQVKNDEAVSFDANGIVIGKVPVGCEPLQTQRRVQQGSGKNIFVVLIETNGNITLARYGTSELVETAAGAWLNIGMTYISKT